MRKSGQPHKGWKAAARQANECERCDVDEALTGAALGRWCYENPNLAALTIEKLRADTPETERLRAALERLASPEAMATGRYQDELTERLKFAFDALAMSPAERGTP